MRLFDAEAKELTNSVPVTIQVHTIYNELCGQYCDLMHPEGFHFCMLFKCDLIRTTDKQDEELYPEYYLGTALFRCDECLKRFGL